MSTWQTAFIPFIMVALQVALVAPAQAQTFEDRWSIVPKAHADPAPSEAPASNQPAQMQTTGQSQTSPDIPRQKARAAARVNTPAARKPDKTSARTVFSGKASYIGYPGGKTASGAPYRPEGFTAAHRTLPFGSTLRVTDLKTGKSVQVVVNDRGPHIKDRVLDLSRGAARVLGMPQRGVINVRAEVIGKAGIVAAGE